jgi:hypothetical protein
MRAGEGTSRHRTHLGASHVSVAKRLVQQLQLCAATHQLLAELALHIATRRHNNSNNNSHQQ